jgi:hypothetical protein
VTVDQTLRPPSANPLEDVATAILGAVEQQLSRYFTAMNERMDALHRGVEHERQSTEQRVRDLAHQQHRRFLELEQYVQQRFDQIETATGIDDETMLEIRQTVRGDIDRSFGEVRHRLDELVAADQRLDEQGTALAVRLVSTADALAKRMDGGDQQLTETVDGRLQALHGELSAAIETVTGQLHERATLLQGRIDSSEARGVDRSLDLEQRMKDELGRKSAEMDAGLGRAAAGFDEAMIAVSRRVLDLENTIHHTDLKIAEIAAQVGELDETVIEELRGQVAQATAAASAVRAELDAVVSATHEHLESSKARLDAMEEKVDDALDVSTAVQLDRLDELERQMLVLEPYVPTATPDAAQDTPNAYAEHGSYDT